MKTVVIVGDDPRVRGARVAALARRAPRLRVLGADGGDAALRALGARRVDVLVTDLCLARVDLLKFLGHVAAAHPTLSVVVAAEAPAPVLFERVRALGAATLLAPADDAEAFCARLCEEMSRYAFGHLQGLSLASVLQVLHIERKTCSVVVTTAGRTGAVYMVAGELVDAQCGALEADDAFYEMIDWEDPDVFIEGACSRVTPRLHLPVVALLIEAARRRDEAAHAQRREEAAGTFAAPS